MKIISLILLLITTCFGHEIIQNQCDLTIETPSLSGRCERKIRLDNGLEMFLISSPSTTQSGAAMAVAAGSWDDPDERAGMAHFVEHLLFLGTEKYPEENDFSHFLDEHNGKHNAYTSSDRTVYGFCVNNSGFSETLDRFANFFINPLFSQSSVDREKNAIHQEFCKDVLIDEWRIQYVKKEIADISHPFHRFCIGNLESLNDVSQDEVAKWYQRHYSSDKMHLVVYSCKDIDSLEKEVVDIFSAVKSRECETCNFPEKVFPEESCGKIVAITPLHSAQTLDLCWELPSKFGSDLLVHPDRLVSYVLGHEGSTSLFYQLKREGLVESICTGNSTMGHDQCSFAISIKLTDEGVRNYEKVILRCFEALASIRQSCIPHYIYDEIVAIKSLNYRFQSQQDVFEFVMNQATLLVDEPLDTFPKLSTLPSVYDRENLEEFLGCLTPYNCQYTLISSNPPNICTTKREHWMGVEYDLVPIKSSLLCEYARANPHPNISIPKPNNFLPKIEKPSEEKKPQNDWPLPQIIEDNPFGRLYSCEDKRFLVPTIFWSFLIKTPLIDPSNSKCFALSDLFSLLVKEKINPTAYEAKLCNLDFTLSTTQLGLELTVKGYGDKALELLRAVVDTMKNVKPTQEDLDLLSPKLCRYYMSQVEGYPLNIGKETLNSIIYKNYSGPLERSSALKSVTLKELQVFCSKALDRLYIQGMLYGNSDTSDVWKTLEGLGYKKPFLDQGKIKKEVATFKGNYSLLVENNSPGNVLILTIDCGDFDFKRYAALAVLSKGLKDPFFTELRTRQQTAYIVKSWSQEAVRHQYSFFAVQSCSHGVSDLLKRFDDFLSSSLEKLSTNVITEQRFFDIQGSLIFFLDHPVENLSQMGELLYALAVEYGGDFMWFDKIKSALSSLTYEEFLQYADQFLSKSSPRVALFVCDPDSNELPANTTTSVQSIKSKISYKGL